MSYQLPSSFLQKFSPKEIHELKSVFKAHDHDYAAAIATTELRDVLLQLGESLTTAQVAAMLQQIPPARANEITFQEFLTLVYELRNGGIALDATAAAFAQASISTPVPAPAPAPAPAPTPTPTPVAVPTRAQPQWKAPSVQAPAQAATQASFAQKAQWPPTAASATTATATPAPAAHKPQWPPGNTTVSASSSHSPAKQWPHTAASSAPTPASPPKSPSKRVWPPPQASASEPAAVPQSPSKPQWPPAGESVPSPVQKQASGKSSWPPAASATPAVPAPSSPAKRQWPPSSAAAASSPSASPVKGKAHWPPTPANPQPSPSAETSKRAQWPPTAAAPAPSSPAAAPPAQSPQRSHAVVTPSPAIGVLQRGPSAATLHEVKGPTSSVHSYSEEETAAFTEHINNCLQNDPDLASLLPIRTKGGLFGSVTNGVLLCKLVNAAVPETIDFRAVNMQKKSKALNVYEMTENQNLSINAAKSIGCSVVNIGPTDLIEGRPILVLGLVWQIIKIQLTSTINLKNHPELVRLLLDGESLEEFMQLPPDQILLRWVNYHLKASGRAPKVVTNFSTDVRDATVYNVLLHQIAPSQCPFSPDTSDAEKLAAHVIQNARNLGIETFIKPRDITSGNPKLNMSFVAQLFNTCPALDVVEAELKQLEDVLYDDVGDTREERVFRMWINSMGIDEVYINHLFSDLRDGMNLLKVFEKIEKGVVAWQKVNLPAANKFKKVENCNYCVVLGKQLKFSLVNIGGADIFEGNKKLILSIIWQSMRYQQLKLLSELARGRGLTSGAGITDTDIIQWANGKVREGGQLSKEIVAFRDLSLSDGLFVLALVRAVEPRAVNWDLVTPGKTDDEKASNAKYAISCAQKIGATVFLTYEDIVEVKPKMMMTFVASLMSVDMHRQ